MKIIVKRSVIISLSLLAAIAISVGLYFFHMFYGNWWDRPSLNADTITEIHIYKDSFRVPGERPVLILDGKSEDTAKIINTINEGWYYWQPVKFSCDYQVDVFQSDSKEGFICIASGIISVRSPDSDRSKNYRMYSQVNLIIDDIIKKSQPGA